jgi:hypothetical protein
MCVDAAGWLRRGGARFMLCVTRGLLEMTATPAGERRHMAAMLAMAACCLLLRCCCFVLASCSLLQLRKWWLAACCLRLAAAALHHHFSRLLNANAVLVRTWRPASASASPQRARCSPRNPRYAATWKLTTNSNAIKCSACDMMMSCPRQRVTLRDAA